MNKKQRTALNKSKKAERAVINRKFKGKFWNGHSTHLPHQYHNDKNSGHADRIFMIDKKSNKKTNLYIEHDELLGTMPTDEDI